MTLVADLFALQELDSAIDQRMAALEDIRARYGESEEASDIRVAIAEYAAGIPELESRQLDLDLQVAPVRAKAAEVEARLYSGSVTSPKELTDLQKDLEQLGRQRRMIEDELLQVLEQLEAKRAGVRESEARLRRVEADWTAGQEQMRADEARLEAEIAELRERRAAQVARIPAAPVTTYDRLRRRRKGVAVVKVERGACLGCRLTVPTVILQRARSGMNPTPVQCPSCERMLYVI
jgi:predicted  nucleic acid-binding Zn-ribbon protein